MPGPMNIFKNKTTKATTMSKTIGPERTVWPTSVQVLSGW